VTSQGHPYAVFRRAIERRNVVAAWAAASELQTLSLPDALALCLLVLDREPARFPRFALRWHARLCAETATLGLDEGRLVLDLLSSLAGPGPRPAARALRELLASRDQKLAEPLRAWEAFAQAQRQPSTASPARPQPATPQAAD
jgi:hypothetical protein